MVLNEKKTGATLHLFRCSVDIFENIPVFA
jgi:hypothetical protein